MRTIPPTLPTSHRFCQDEFFDRTRFDVATNPVTDSWKSLTFQIHR
jgi:hypothetical protein